MAKESAYGRFMEEAGRFEGKLYRFALLQTGSRAAASDILKEAFASCYRADLWRAGAEAFERRAFGMAFELCNAGRRGAESAALEDALPARLCACLAGIPPFARAAVVLTFFCRFSAREAAEILRIPEARVRALNRGWMDSIRV